MNAIKFSQQKELPQVITVHIKTSAIYCFGRHKTDYSSNSKLYIDNAIKHYLEIMKNQDNRNEKADYEPKL